MRSDEGSQQGAREEREREMLGKSDGKVKGVHLSSAA
jgi:hypothetical protein